MQETLSSGQSVELVRLWRRRQTLSPDEMGEMYRMVGGALRSCNPPELRVLGEGRQELVAQFIYVKVLRLDADPDEADDAASHGAPSSAFALCACFRRYLIERTRASALARKRSVGYRVTESSQFELRVASAENAPDELAAHGLSAPSVHAAARAFIAGLPEPERILLREGLAPRHVIACCHYRAGRLGLVHKREGLPADYARTTLGQWISQTLGIAIEAGSMGAILQVFRILGAEATGPAANGDQPTAAAHIADATLLLPLIELAQRREAVARRAFPARWAPGRLVSVLHEGRLLGLLLDKCVHDTLWRGWMAASEADAASACDVLLEPGDGPFEPMFGLIQTWNVLTLEQTPKLCARVLGEVSATRLAAIRAVHDEWAVQQPLPIEPEPGRIALRTAGGVFSVLSGTPLGVGDPRADYQSLYLEAAARLASPLQATTKPGSLSVAAPAAEGWWPRVKAWFATDRVARPALALLALVVVVQNATLLRSGVEDDPVRFRSVQGPVTSTAPADLSLRWRAGVGMDDANALLRSAGAELVGGPDADGRWHLRIPANAAQGRAMLAGSPLVDSVGPPWLAEVARPP